MSRPRKRLNGAGEPPHRDVWLGSQREKEVAWLQGQMAATDDPKAKYRLAGEARKVRHGTKNFYEAEQFSFGLALQGVRLPAVH